LAERETHIFPIANIATTKLKRKKGSNTKNNGNHENDTKTTQKQHKTTQNNTKTTQNNTKTGEGSAHDQLAKEWHDADLWRQI
jgi:hypothetical protein